MSNLRLISIVPALLLLLAPLAHADDMIPSAQIGNDPAKAKLCVSRAKMGKPAPFVISARYLKEARNYHSDATFVAFKEEIGAGQLVECYLRDGTGRYEPASLTPENRYWQLANKPQRYQPDLSTNAGKDIASRIYRDAASARMSRTGFSHSVTTRVVEVQGNNNGMVAGKKSHQYDVIVEGKSFFRSSGPDLKAKTYSCLLSPMCEVKAVTVKG